MHPSLRAALFAFPALLAAGVFAARADAAIVVHPSGSATAATGTVLDQADTLEQVRRIRPSFPAAAQRTGQQGCVVVRFDVAPSGKPVHVRAWFGVPPGVFDAAAVATVKQWRFKSTRRGRPAWTYGVFQKIDFLLNAFSDSMASPDNAGNGARISWMCSQPPPRAAQIRRAPPGLDGSAAIATYGTETLAYLPLRRSVALPTGMPKVAFCVDAEGAVADPRIVRNAADARLGPLAVQILRTWSFTPFRRGGDARRICHLTWSIPLVTLPLAERPQLCGCAEEPLKIRVLPDGTPGPQGPAAPTHRTAEPAAADAGTSLCLDARGEVTRASIAANSDPGIDSLVLDVIEDFHFFPQHDDAGRPVASCGWYLKVEVYRASNSPPAPRAADAA